MVNINAIYAWFTHFVVNSALSRLRGHSLSNSVGGGMKTSYRTGPLPAAHSNDCKFGGIQRISILFINVGCTGV